MTTKLDHICPGCNKPAVLSVTGSNIHWYTTYRCRDGHEWVVPYSQEQIDEWMQVNDRS